MQAQQRYLWGIFSGQVGYGPCLLPTLCGDSSASSSPWVLRLKSASPTCFSGMSGGSNWGKGRWHWRSTGGPPCQARQGRSTQWRDCRKSGQQWPQTDPGWKKAWEKINRRALRSSVEELEGCCPWPLLSSPPCLPGGQASCHMGREKPGSLVKHCSHFLLIYDPKSLRDPSPGSGVPFAPIQACRVDTNDELNPSQVCEGHLRLPSSGNGAPQTTRYPVIWRVRQWSQVLRILVLWGRIAQPLHFMDETEAWSVEVTCSRSHIMSVT